MTGGEARGRGRPRQRPLVQLGGVHAMPGGSRRLCTLERAPTPGGSQRSPIVFKQEKTPAQERGSARKRRLDRNRQAELYAVSKLARGAKVAKPTKLEFEQRVVDSVDMAHPDSSFDMEALDDRIRMAQRSWRHDQREAAAVMQGAADPEEKVRAAVHLMMGRGAHRQWTQTGKLRAVCDTCKRAYAVTLDGRVRKHGCSLGE